MNTPKDYQLTVDQRRNPVVWASRLPLEEVKIVRLVQERTDDFLIALFGSLKRSLKTWGKEEQSHCPHWIAVKNGTPLHTDPGYARFTHQLVVRDDGWLLHGVDADAALSIREGAIFCLDTHSPHRLRRRDRRSGPYYCAVSYDANEFLAEHEAIALLLSFLRDAI